MAPTKEYLSTVLTEAFPEPNIPFHAVADEKPAVPDCLLQTIKAWKNSLYYWEKEGYYFMKLIRWNGTPSNSNKSKSVCDRFFALAENDLHRFIEKIEKIETEISVALLDNAGAVQDLARKFEVLEEELNAFKMKMEKNKLELLGEIINSSAVSFV